MTAPRARRTSALLGLALTGTLIAGCSGISSDSGRSDSVSSMSAPDYAGRSAPSASATAAGGSAAPADSGSANTTVETAQQKLARRGSISLQVDDIGKATAAVRAANSANEGFVLSENIGSYGARTGAEGINPSTYATLTISVPSDRLDGTLDALQKLGKVLDRSTETENVTAEYVDVQARVASMKRSVARIDKLIDSTDDIDQLVRLERELSTRQAELESVEARLQQLDRQTDRSPISVTLATAPDLIDELDNPATGFLGGLKSGWNAFVASVVALMTVLGALLPFALVAALVLWPVWRMWRRRRAGRGARPAVVTRRKPVAATPTGGTTTTGSTVPSGSSTHTGNGTASGDPEAGS